MNTAEISFIVILGVMGAFYLIFIRPAAREQKRVQATIRDLAVGDEVITTAGFFATIKGIETPEDGPVQIVLDFGNGVVIRSLSTSIMQRVSAAKEPADRVEEAGGV
jgi:preprotein translocase subunit YajC